MEVQEKVVFRDEPVMDVDGAWKAQFDILSPDALRVEHIDMQVYSGPVLEAEVYPLTRSRIHFRMGGEE